MITAAYTICKNEIDKVDRWVEYTRFYDYRVILDTGSTDGTYEKLKKVPGIIITQISYDPKEFDYSVGRNCNLSMIPDDVDWCLSPDLDEFYSINTLETIKQVHEDKSITSIGCPRLDIYSDVVYVGQPKFIGTNKIHRRHCYRWKQPIYEYLNYCGDKTETEYYTDEIFLIHDKDTKKQRDFDYAYYMQREYEKNPKNNWNNWFLLNHWYKEKNTKKFVDVACNYLINHDRKEIDRYEIIKTTLYLMMSSKTLEEEEMERIKFALQVTGSASIQS